MSMDFEGSGMLALWNGADPARREEYNLWHSREHVPQRLSVPGMRSARRYVRLHGPQPEYLTLYEVTDNSVLSTSPYVQQLEHPTEWSGSMRPSFRGFLRVCCNRLQTQGGGMGSVLVVLAVESGLDLDSPEMGRALERIIASPCGIVAAHVLRRDPSVPMVPFTIMGTEDPAVMQGAVLFESFGAETMRAALDRVEPLLREVGLGVALERMTLYALAYALASTELDQIVPLSLADFRAAGSTLADWDRQ